MGFTAYPVYSGPESTRLLLLKQLEGIVPQGVYDGFEVEPYVGASIRILPGRLFTVEAVNVKNDSQMVTEVPIGATTSFKLVIRHLFDDGNPPPEILLKEIGVEPIDGFDTILAEIQVLDTDTEATQFTIIPVDKIALGFSVGVWVSSSDQLEDLWGRFGEGSYTVNRDLDGLVSSVTTLVGGTVLKTFSFTRDSEDRVATIVVTTSDGSFSRTYSTQRDPEGIITGIDVA